MKNSDLEVKLQKNKFVLTKTLPSFSHSLQISKFTNVAKSVGKRIKTAARSIWSFGKKILAKGANFFRNIPMNTINAIDAIKENKHFSLH